MKVSLKKRLKSFTPFRRPLKAAGATKKEDESPPVYIVPSLGDDARDEPTEEAEASGALGDREDELVDAASLREQEEEVSLSHDHSHEASIGDETAGSHGTLLDKMIPDLVKDEEDGIVAMFREMHANLPEAPEQVKAMQAGALAQILKVWRQVEGTSAARMALTDEDASMVAMFREIAGSIGGGLTRGGQAASGFMDTLLARILSAVQGLGKIPELVAPTPERSMESEDVSLQAMFREIAQLFPGTSEAEVEDYMLARVGQVAEKASRKKSGE